MTNKEDIMCWIVQTHCLEKSKLFGNKEVMLLEGQNYYTEPQHCHREILFFTITT